MSAVYYVTGPGDEKRLVHAGSQAVAINHAVRGSVKAKAVTSSELHKFLQDGMQVEEAVDKQRDAFEDTAPVKPKKGT